MTKYYTYSELHYGESIENLTIGATETSDTRELSRASKKLLVRNNGSSSVYLAFDKDTATDEDFLLEHDDGLVELPVQCKMVSAVCGATETTEVRITSCY